MRSTVVARSMATRGEGLGGGHLLLDALPLLHQLVVAACRHLLQSTGSAASTRAARTEGEHLTIRNRKHIHQIAFHLQQDFSVVELCATLTAMRMVIYP